MKLKILCSLLVLFFAVPMTVFADSNVIGTDNTETAVVLDSLELIGPRLATVKAAVDVVDDSLGVQGNRLSAMVVTLNTKASQTSVNISNDSLAIQGNRQVAINATITTNLDATVSSRATSAALAVAQDSLNLLNPSLLYTDVVAIKTATDRLTGSDTRGTYAYTNAGGEQTVVTIPISSRAILHTVWLDLSTMTQNGTMRLKYQVDGTNARTFATTAFTTSGDDAAYSPPGIAVDDTVIATYQETVDETADRDIQFHYIIETME